MPVPPPDYVPGHGLLTGKTVVITAAAGTGIGSAVALRCLAEGAQVVISDKHERRLAAARDELARAHGVDMPITEAVVAILDGRITVEHLAPLLLGRELKAEATTA